MDVGTKGVATALAHGPFPFNRLFRAAVGVAGMVVRG
jgi:hypothetical protein